MTLYLIVNRLFYPIGEYSFDDEPGYLLGTQPKPMSNSPTQQKNMILLPHLFDDTFRTDPFRGMIHKLSETSAEYTPFVQPKDEQLVAHLSGKKQWHHRLLRRAPPGVDVPLEKNRPFVMKLEDRCVIPVGSVFSISLSSTPVMDDFRERRRQAAIR